MEKFLGVTYKLSESEYFDEFMRALGVGPEQRKLANTISPVIKLTKKNGIYTFFTATPYRNDAVNFTPSVEFDEATLYGKTVKSIVKINGTTMVHTQRSGTLIVTITREFSKDEVTAIFKVGDVVCRRVYTRVK